MLQCIRRHCMAINALPLEETESGCLCSRRGISIKRTRHNFTYNVPYRLVLDWPVVGLVTSVYCIYQHRPSRDWLVFLSPDRVTPNGMPRRRIYNNWFCTHYHRIDVANLTKWFNETKYLWRLCQRDVHHRNLRIGIDCLLLYIREKHIFHRWFCESTEEGPEKLDRSVWNIFLIEQQIKYWNCPSICFAITPRILRRKEH